MHIPDLWRINEDASRLYQLYLCRLSMNCLYDRVVTASRQIRRHASCGPGRKAGLFTFSFELDALCALRQYQTAWRQLQRWEEIAQGRRIDIRARTWSIDDMAWFEYHHVPLLYFRGRYRQGRRLLEAMLDVKFVAKRPRSYDFLFRIYNGDKEPTDRCRVTLAHFYARLGKDLLHWPRWESFVNGFHPRLFNLAGVWPHEMLADSRRLAAFHDRLMAIRAERTKSGVTEGERDLTDSEEAVRKRQNALQEKRDRFKASYMPTTKILDTKLQELFPELRNLEGEAIWRGPNSPRSPCVE